MHKLRLLLVQDVLIEEDRLSKSSNNYSVICA